MTGAAIVTMFETLIGDTLDNVVAYQLLNNAKNKVEGERDWEMLKKLNSSQSAGSGALSLPTDYSRTIAIYVNNIPYYQIPFEQQKLLSGSSCRWYLDHRNNCFYLLGSPTGTVNHFYIYQTDDITDSTSPVWPTRFHALLAYEMAELFFAIDQGERNFAWDDKWAMQKEILRRSMIDWNASLQKNAIENALPIDTDISVDLSMM